MSERTLSILKPDVLEQNIIGKVNSYIEKSGLKIIAQKMIMLNRKQVEAFYAVHKDRPFFPDLVNFMTSGKVIVQVLEGNNAVAKYREIMGATDPKQATPGTIRADFAKSIDANCVHGSDSLENAALEIAFFFSESDLV